MIFDDIEIRLSENMSDGLIKYNLDFLRDANLEVVINKKVSGNNLELGFSALSDFIVCAEVTVSNMIAENFTGATDENSRLVPYKPDYYLTIHTFEGGEVPAQIKDNVILKTTMESGLVYALLSSPLRLVSPQSAMPILGEGVKGFEFNPLWQPLSVYMSKSKIGEI